MAPILTLSNARTALEDGLAHLATGADQVDCAPLVHFDSSALAILLAWQRAACARGTRLRLSNVSPKLRNLARAYGIEALILPDEQGAPHERFF